MPVLASLMQGRAEAQRHYGKIRSKPTEQPDQTAVKERFLAERHDVHFERAVHKAEKRQPAEMPGAGGGLKARAGRQERRHSIAKRFRWCTVALRPRL